MSKKKLMLLGGLSYLIPVIETAHKLGIHVITVDYLPDNTAHKYSDEYHNVNIVDIDAVLQLARELQIDGIMSFAVDPGVITAAYVAEKMNLPFQCSFENACILQDKSLFRKFLKDNKFNTPKALSFSKEEDALNNVDDFSWPIIVKPVDSAGSKGVTKVEEKSMLPEAIKRALDKSFSGKFIVEEFLDIVGFQSSADCFTINGHLDYCTFSDQIFDRNIANPFVPIAEIYPSTMDMHYQNALKGDLQRLFDLLKVKDGIYNIESRVCSNGKVYIMEVSPRGGGNMLAKLQDMAANQNLIENEVRKAVGLELKPMCNPLYDGVWASFALDTSNTGYYDSIRMNSVIKELNVKATFINVQKEDAVHTFTGANSCLGDVLLRCNDREEMDDLVYGSSNWLNIIVKSNTRD